MQLFTEYPPSNRAVRQTADRLKRAKHSQHDGDIASGTAPDLIGIKAPKLTPSADFCLRA
jgi:hypothetical protein